MFAIFAIAQLAGRLTMSSPRNWEIREFNIEYASNSIDFVVEAHPNQLVATLTNNHDYRIQVWSNIALAKLTDPNSNEWRTVPFNDVAGYVAPRLVHVPSMGSTELILSPEMLSVNLPSGQYRIIAEVWHDDNEQRINSQVWAEFELLDE